MEQNTKASSINRNLIFLINVAFQELGLVAQVCYPSYLGGVTTQG
jgi:hypothetical protein